jgi:hypothetical protein
MQTILWRVLVGVCFAGRLAAAEPGAPAKPAQATVVSTPPLPAPAGSLMQGSGERVLVDLARMDLSPGKPGSLNDRSAQDRLRASDRPATVEESGGAVRYLRRTGGLRGLGALFNPFSPVTKVEVTPVSAYEARRPLDFAAPESLRLRGSGTVPRAFRDPITQEYGVRFW